MHAPRQTGKTTALRALARDLTAQGRYAGLHFSCEVGESAGDDYGAAGRDILAQIRFNVDDHLPAELHPPAWPVESEGSLLQGALRAWAQACPRPLVLFFDEIDALRGLSLVNVLRQLRAGFPERASGDFPLALHHTRRHPPRPTRSRRDQDLASVQAEPAPIGSQAARRLSRPSPA
nr:ATP-binding protein [Candidatus Frankia alpina]